MYMSDKVKLRVDLSSKEDKSNKVTTLSSSNTDTQYPSAKVVYDTINELQLSGGGNYINDYYFDTTTKELVIDYTSDDSGSGGSGGSADIVTSWSALLSDAKVPSEKLVKNTLDTKQDTLVSGTSIKTINNTSLLGSGNISITGGNGDVLDVDNFYIDTTNDEIVIVSGTGGGGSNVTVDSSWVTNSTNPVESQLIKSALDGKANSTHTHTVSNITDFPTIPSKTSDLQNDSGFLTSHQSLTNYIQKSNTGGLIKNDGTVDTNTYLTSHQSLTGYLQTTDVVDNLNSTSTTAPLSAKQGKELNDLIGNILTIINGSGS